MQGVWKLQIRIVLSPLCVVGGGSCVVGGCAAASGESPVFVFLNEPVEIVGNSNIKKLHITQRDLQGAS